MSKNPKIILASKSPRRHELLQLMHVDFEVQLKEVDESYPNDLEPKEVAKYIAEKKALAFNSATDQIVITADTIVCIQDEILGKPIDKNEALTMLRKLSGKSHLVYTGVCVKRGDSLIAFVEETKVYFREVSEQEIDFYIEHYSPYDKAGSYGIQDWWGVNVVSRIEGSYTNVMGLPTESLYNRLKEII